MAVSETHHTTTYFVNGESQTTTEHELTVGQILENAGSTPASNYELEDDNTGKTYTDPSEAVHVHEGQRFTATYTGPTPTS